MLEMWTSLSWRGLLQGVRMGGAGKNGSLLGARGLTTQKLSHYMELVQADQTYTSPQEGRPLTVIFTWLMAKPNYVKKYVNLFTDIGVDVLKVQISPMDLMQPTTRSQVCAQEVVDYLHANPQFDRILVYGFSVGAYQFCESVKKMNETPGMELLLDRFVGHIWDSPVDVPNMPVGVAKSVTNNEQMQAMITKYVEWFLKVRYQVATRHYYGAAHYMHKGPLRAPGLYLYAKSDPMSAAHINESIIDKWRNAGLTVYTKAFEKAPHCALSVKYPEEYKALMDAFLVEIGFKEQSSRQRAAV